MNIFFGCESNNFALSFVFLFRANVCSRVIYEQDLYRISVRYTTIEWYTTCCTDIIWCWDECQRSRWEIIYHRCYCIRIFGKQRRKELGKIHFKVNKASFWNIDVITVSKYLFKLTKKTFNKYIECYAECIENNQ